MKSIVSLDVVESDERLDRVLAQVKAATAAVMVDHVVIARSEALREYFLHLPRTTMAAQRVKIQIFIY